MNCIPHHLQDALDEVLSKGINATEIHISSSLDLINTQSGSFSKKLNHKVVQSKLFQDKCNFPHALSRDQEFLSSATPDPTY